jgi:hypothetical protein
MLRSLALGTLSSTKLLSERCVLPAHFSSSMQKLRRATRSELETKIC